MPVSIPPFTNVPAPNDPVASEWAQQLTQFAVDQYLAQPGQPASPNTELWFDTDDPGMSFPNVPRGYIGHAIAPSVVSGIAATVTDLGAAVTWTADPTRQYKISVLSGRLDQISVSSNGVFAGIYDGANTYRQGSYIAVAAGGYAYVNTFVIESGLSGSQTRKARANTQSGTLTAQAGTILLVEDIGAAGQSGGGIYGSPTPWTAVTFQNGWINYGGAYQTAQYRKVGDEVQVRGTIKSGTQMTVAFTLPAGFRPPAKMQFSQESSDAHSWIEVDAAGQVIMSKCNPAAANVVIQFSTVAT